MKFWTNGNWGLKFLALILAIVVYHALKTDSTSSLSNHDRSFFQSR